MRKTCAQPVDDLRKSCEHEHNLYPSPRVLRTHHVLNPHDFPTPQHTITTTLSTAFFRPINLLKHKLSPFSTGLITNTTKYI